MIDDPQTPGAGPEGTGQETNLGGTASEWSTVSPTQPLAPPPQSLEPLPPPPPPNTPPQQPVPGGYEQVYGSQPQTPPAGGYASAPGGGYTPPPPPPPGFAGGPGPQYPPPAGSTGPGLSSNAAAAISYITFIPAIIFLVVAPYNQDRFVRFHAWQSIALWVVSIAISVIFGVLSFTGLHLLWWTLHSLIDLALFVLWLIALIKASQGQWYKIPIVGDLATSFSGGQV